jgi:DNA polymerase-1
MIVSRTNFIEVVDRLSRTGEYGLDTETTGLSRQDRLFSVILADEAQGYYFNFNQGADHLGNVAPLSHTLPREWIAKLQHIFSNPESLFYIHNAKFDLGMLAREGIEIRGRVHCTEAMARVLKNNLMTYKLAHCAARIGLKKDPAVDDYVKKHKLYTKIRVPGKSKLFELKHFEKVPFQIMTAYAENDARLHLALGKHQVAEFEKIDATAPTTAPKIAPLVANERRLTKVCFRMEETGIRINRSYAQGALSYTQQVATSAMKSFEELTGMPYENSATALRDVFNKFGVKLPLTATGKPCTKAEVLESLDNPISKKILEIRTAEKLASTYYSSFLHFADQNDLIHAGIRQGGTETSRFSYGDPNLQNLPKEDEPEDQDKPFLVRRCFVPLSDDFLFVPIDFKQQEFRMMLDYAGEKAMIDAIMGGMDVHDATAKLIGITRKQAKTINFGLLYGMGADKLARSLGVTLNESYDLRNRYFSKLPKVRHFIRTVINTGEGRGYIWNWFGFRNHLFAPEFAYVLPNHLIQGGCAQVLRRALVEVDEYIQTNGLRSRMLVQVHDEILFQVHKSELHHIPEFQKIMEGIYKPRNGLRLDCSVEHSTKSYAKWDQVKGLP